jgi:hypothetical protein
MSLRPEYTGTFPVYGKAWTRGDNNNINESYVRCRPGKPKVGTRIIKQVIPIEGVFLRSQVPGQVEADKRRSIIVDGRRSYGGYYDET